MVKDRGFAEEFSRCLATLLKRNPSTPIWSKGLFVVQLRCRTLNKLMEKPLELEKIRRFTEHCKQCKSAFLRGFFDSEGSISAYNTGLRLIEYVKQLMDSLGIATTGPHINKKQGTTVRNQETEKHTRPRRTHIS
ncbi:MAG: LAGLIDADG family homing endonuclease [Candidatus Caldarchaeum sp.]